MKNIVKYTFFYVTIFLLGLCCLKIYLKQSYVVIYLCYPIIVYVITFGFDIEPFLRTVFEGDSVYMNGTPLHCCSTNPSMIRAEIAALKKDFNNRFKQVIFTTLLNAYYASVIPCCFAQKFLYYDIWMTTSHMAFVVIGGLTMCTMFCFPANYCDVLHRAALHLGGWVRIENRTHTPALNWSKLVVWPNGSFVKYSGDYYRSNGLVTTAVPCNSFHNRFYIFFQNPAHLYAILTSIQVILIFVQMVLLFCTTEWHNTLSLGFLLLSNYYTLFKMIRDFLITHKIYVAESAINKKINGYGN
ncbi:hypothetical protein HA402_003422 [Bradysia odoriphaga]|nr:hypothetical protein HA402_003422 [Bradysia odoriphaga]